MAIYIHFPFCPELCYFCFCVKTITKKRDRITRYLEYLHREIDMLQRAFDEVGLEPDVCEVTFGGGTPTYMERGEFDGVLAKLSSFVDFGSLSEMSLEVDPRTVVVDDIDFYLDRGVTRLSFGIQDFDAKVQKAINRVQSYEMVEALVAEENRRCSINFDLIYGLPHQTRQRFKETLRLVKQLDPDRLAIYNYDHTPDIHKNMRAIHYGDLPSKREKRLMYIDAVEDLVDGGYVHIGVDHFAKPDDKLAQAYKKKNLWRNLGGYTTFRDYYFEIGLGNSSISSFNTYYTHNIKAEAEYYVAIDKGNLPIMRGFELDSNDFIRRSIILQIICLHYLDFKQVEQDYDISFTEYFANDLPLLDELVADGLVEVGESHLEATDLGKIFIHHIARVFDDRLVREGAYIRTHAAIIKERA